MQIAPGAKIDRYIVEALVGRGGMAEVWCVRHQLLGTRHALKVLLYAHTAMQRRLLQEGRAQALLDHPNLLPVRDVLDVDGKPALLLPLVDGPSLETLLQGYRPTRAEALALLRGLAEGLAFAHGQGFVHRDLKPGNVLLEQKGGKVQPRISDFGLVKVQGADQTDDGSMLGTPAYAAPEQLRDAASADARTDLFSLGVLAAELLAGARPFAGTTPVRIADAHRRPPQLDGIEDDLRDLVASLLEIDPERRPPSAAAVLTLLPEADPEALGASGGLARAMAGPRLPQSDLSTPPFGGPPGSGAPPAADATMGPPAHNLPRPRDAFVGRYRELAALRECLARPGQDGARLATVTGPGGAGKTRLVVEFCRAFLAWPGGVWVCDLAEAQDAAGICAAVARSLEVPLGADPATQLGYAIAGRGPCLVVLDNFEQVVEHAATTVGRWLDLAEEATFLVTSREPLRLRGEAILVLDPLDLDEAVALFAARARAARQGFAVTDENRGAVEGLVELLDRLPLAIELAATRSRMLDPAQLTSRLAQRFSLLSSRSPDLPERHRALEATLAWSWDLLRPWEQAALAQMSVFEGGFTFEAAEAVLDLSAFADAPWLEDVLAELIDKSLLRRTTGAQTRQPRLALLVSVQEFAARRLCDAGAARRRHSAHFALLGAEEAIATLGQAGGIQRMQCLIEELDNLLAACREAIAARQPALVVCCARAVSAITSLVGPFSLGLGLLAAAREGAVPDDAQRAELLRLEGDLLASEGRNLPLSEDRLREALALFEGQGDDRRAGLTRSCLGHTCVMLGKREEGEAHLRASLATARQVGNRRDQILALGLLGHVLLDAGRIDEAMAIRLDHLALAREDGDRHAEALALRPLGGIYTAKRQFQQAEEHLQAALAICREAGNRFHESSALNGLATLRVAQDRTAEAFSFFEAALAMVRQIGSRQAEPIVLTNLGRLNLVSGRHEAARSQLQAALALSRQSSHLSGVGLALGMMGWMLREQGRYAEAEAHLQEALALDRQSDHRPQEGAALVQLGLLRLEMGQGQDAEEALRVALAIYEDLGDLSCQSQVIAYQAERLLSAGRPEAALAALGAAPAAAWSSILDGDAEGPYRGALGLALAASGEPAAREELDRGAARLRRAGRRPDLARLLCQRVEAERLLGNPGGLAAEAALAEAEDLAAAMGSPPGSHLARRIADLRLLQPLAGD